MTPKERAAMQQALEALENYGIDGTKSVGGIKCTEAITALREALDHSGEANEIVEFFSKEMKNKISVARAEQAEQEPVAWKQTVRALTDQCAALIQERDELQKQVWRYEKHGVTCQTFGHKVESSCAECNENEIYAAPVRTKDLTEEEIENAVGQPMTKAEIADCRAAIAADRRKNK